MKQKHSTCWVSRLSTKTADHLVIRVITLLIVFVFSQVNSCNPFTTISWILRSSMNNNYHFPENNDSSTTYYCFHYLKRLCNCSNCSYVSPLVQIFQQFRLHHPPTDEEVQTGLSIMTIESEARAKQILTL